MWVSHWTVLSPVLPVRALSGKGSMEERGENLRKDAGFLGGGLITAHHALTVSLQQRGRGCLFAEARAYEEGLAIGHGHRPVNDCGGQ